MSPSDAVDGSSTRHVSAMDIGAVRGSHDPEEPNMKRSRQSVSISRSRCFRFTAWPGTDPVRPVRAARRHAWHWSGIGDRAGCQRRRSKGVPIRKRLLGLDWAGAEAELERRQGQVRRYQQAGRSLSAQPVHDRRGSLSSVGALTCVTGSEKLAVLPIGTVDGVRASRH
jgi:hypothetical protein